MFSQLSAAVIKNVEEDVEYKDKIKKLKEDMENKMSKQQIYLKNIDRWIDQMPQLMK